MCLIRVVFLRIGCISHLLRLGEVFMGEWEDLYWDFLLFDFLTQDEEGDEEEEKRRSF